MPTNYDRLFNQAQGDALINVLGGIKSSLDANYPLEDVSANFSNVAQLITPSENYFGINSVNLSAVNLGVLNANENGEYNAVTMGYDGFSDVNVNVSGGGGVSSVLINNGQNMLTAVNIPVTFADDVISMSNCFFDCQSFNQPINIPNSVTNMEKSFFRCVNFDQSVIIPNNVITTYSAFGYCYNLNSPITFESDSNCFNVSYMFQGCNNFNQSVNFPSSVTDLTFAFQQCYNLNQPIVIPNNATSVHTMFSACNNFNQPVNIPDSVVNCAYMLYYCTNFNSPVSIGNNVTNMFDMFCNCQRFNQPITIPNTVKDCTYAFALCNDFNQPIVVPGTVDRVKEMFNWCFSFSANAYVNLSSVLTSANGSSMFKMCNSMQNLFLTGVKTTFTQFIRSNNTKQLNIYSDDASIANFKDVSSFIQSAGAVTWETDSANNCIFNTRYNVYIYNNWDGTIPSVL